MEFICYPKCSTCQKAKKWLDENKIVYTERHIVEANPSAEELKMWYKRSGLPLKKFFNTSGRLYKEMKLKDKLSEMSEEEQIKLLATNGMLVKRPLVVDEDKVLVVKQILLSKSEISQIIRGKGGGGLWKMNLVALKKLLDEYIVKEGERVLRIKKPLKKGIQK